MNGIGETPTSLLHGTHVGGYFRDGENLQQPVVTHTFKGIPSEKRSENLGFSDPDGIYPLKNMLGQPDTNRLATNTEIDTTIVKTKRDGVETSVETSVGTWDEPETKYATLYPNNHVRETKSGHIFEADDTEGAERIHTYHKSGTFIEYFPDGTVVRKIKGDNFEIVEKDSNVLIKGVCNITIEKDANVYFMENVNAKIDGDLEAIIGGGVEATVGGDMNADVTGSFSAKAQSIKLESLSTMDLIAPSVINMKTTLVSATGEVKDSVRTMSADRLIFDVHTHSVPGVMGGPATVIALPTPNQQ
jgi:hypothetical protein